MRQIPCENIAGQSWLDSPSWSLAGLGTPQERAPRRTRGVDEILHVRAESPRVGRGTARRWDIVPRFGFDTSEKTIRPRLRSGCAPLRVLHCRRTRWRGHHASSENDQDVLQSNAGHIFIGRFGPASPSWRIVPKLVLVTVLILSNCKRCIYVLSQ